MGYYVEGNGSVTVKNKCKNLINEIISTLDSKFGYAECYDGTMIVFGMSGNYHEDEIKEFLDSIIYKIDSGELIFSGESGDNWRFIFDSKSMCWREQDRTAVIYGDDLSDIDTQNLINELSKRGIKVTT